MQDSNVDYYEVLHLHPSAHPDVVQAAYRRLALLYHPDKNPSPEATNLMAQVNQAYDVLSDPEKRAAYDRSREAHSSRPTPPPSSSARTEGDARPSAGSSSGRQSGSGVGLITLGSSKSDVLGVQSSPSDTRVYPNLNEETWYYDSGDSIDFDLDTGRVRGWSNVGSSLRARIVSGSNASSANYFREGYHRYQVARFRVRLWRFQSLKPWIEKFGHTAAVAPSSSPFLLGV